MSEWTEFEEIRLDGITEVGERVWLNSRYQVRVNEFPNGITYLSIKRVKKEHIHDWREILRIKNELCGPLREAVELYPGTFRVVDTTNQYHLFVMPEGTGINLGFLEPHIDDESPDEYVFNEPRQRPLPSWMPRIAQDPATRSPFATGDDGEGGIALTFPMDFEGADEG
jgi:hypothetical protein